MIIPILLAYGVILINGWTDAPNSIATAIASNAISYKKASILCGFFNLLGVIFACALNTSVAEFVFSLGDFNSHTTIGISVVFATMLLYGIVSYFLGLPSSESHAMIVSIIGVTFSATGKLSGIKKVGDVFVFMVFSCFLAFLLSYIARMLLRWNLPYKRLQLISCSLTSFMHGWQGGLKFIGILAFLLGIKITNGKIPVFLALSVGITLCLGALIGSGRIIDSMGENLIKTEHKTAFSSDIGTYASLLICSILGMPVSTGNIKCLAIIGSGCFEKQKINKKTATKLFVSFIAVFPVCFFISYLLMKLMLLF